MKANIVNIDQKVDLRKACEVLDTTCIKGNLDPTGLLLKGTPEEIKEEAGRCIKIGGRGYILSPGCELSRDTPYENLKALVEAARIY
ncbi:MAG: uroporphyrinogen decarboxylase [Halanaerobiales bacterium]|nr:uroporphyrinogen decarboxylase [Halanaerobiales bacterium]